jgi:hypothetical protein
MTRAAAVLILFGGLICAAMLFFVGTVFTSGENDHVYWEMRGPIWGLGAAAALVAGGGAWLAIRAGRS